MTTEPHIGTGHGGDVVHISEAKSAPRQNDQQALYVAQLEEAGMPLSYESLKDYLELEEVPKLFVFFSPAVPQGVAKIPMASVINIALSKGDITVDQAASLFKKTIYNISQKVPGGTLHEEAEAQEEPQAEAQDSDELSIVDAMRNEAFGQMETVALSMLDAAPSKRYLEVVDIIKGKKHFRDIDVSTYVSSLITEPHPSLKQYQHRSFVTTLINDAMGTKLKPSEAELPETMWAGFEPQLSAKEVASLIFLYTYAAQIYKKPQFKVSTYLQERSLMDIDILEETLLKQDTGLADDDIRLAFSGLYRKGVNLRGLPIIDGDGEMTGEYAFATPVDISEIPVVSEELEQPRRNTRKLALAATALVALLAAGGGYLLANSDSPAPKPAAEKQAQAPLELRVSKNGGIFDPGKTRGLWESLDGVEVITFETTVGGYATIVSYKGVVYHGVISEGFVGHTARLPFKSFGGKAPSQSEAEAPQRAPITLPIKSAGGKFLPGKTRYVWENNLKGVTVHSFGTQGANYVLHVEHEGVHYLGKLPASGITGTAIEIPAREESK
jgi:hypothetical protein